MDEETMLLLYLLAKQKTDLTGDLHDSSRYSKTKCATKIAYKAVLVSGEMQTLQVYLLPEGGDHSHISPFDTSLDGNESTIIISLRYLID